MVPKFRGRNIETGEWVYGHLFYFDDGRHFISPTGTDVVGGYGGAPAKYRLENLVCFEIVPETVGESTGLIDRNGVEIFEGDIVKIIGDVLDDDMSVIRFTEGGFYLDYKNLDTEFELLYSIDLPIEIIGNIYENPELLEVEV